MKIKFIKPASPIGFAYSDPQELDCTEAFGDEMIELGYAIKVQPGKGDLPHDFPGRKALVDNGFLTLDEVKKIATVEKLSELNGIGKKLGEQIVAAVEETDKK